MEQVGRRVVGIDAYPRGWVAVILADGKFASALAASALGSLVSRYEDATAIAVDMPIGLPVSGFRRCDIAAARFVGGRRSSVFMTPPRQALLAATHAEAVKICRRLTGAGLSQQAFALRARIFEAEAVADQAPQVFEVHPEVSFRAMNGEPLPTAKATWAGLWQRLELLRIQEIHLPGTGLGLAGLVPPVDLIDAAAAAWSAHRRAAGMDVAIVEPEPTDSSRRSCIWY